MGGIGITPAIAFCRHIHNIEMDCQLYLDYSTVTADQIIYAEEFATFSRSNKKIIVNHRITVAQGYLTEEEVHKVISSYPGCHIYVCGPKAFESLVLKAARSANIATDHTHVEQFIHAGAPETVSQSNSM